MTISVARRSRCCGPGRSPSERFRSFPRAGPGRRPDPLAGATPEAPALFRLHLVVDGAEPAEVVELSCSVAGEVEAPVVDLEVVGRPATRYDAMGIPLGQGDPDSAWDDPRGR